MTSATSSEQLAPQAEELEEYVEQCTDNFGDSDESYYPWQNNVLATDIVVHPGGRFVRDEDEATPAAKAPPKRTVRL